uniref:Uncharacterized protein n=1 Tax=Aegilops tauschii TaxID=37682 RepID=M8BM40_AEGTA
MFVWVLGSGGCAAGSVRVPLDGGGDDTNLLRLQTSLPPLLRFVPLPLARSAVATPPEDVLALFLSHIGRGDQFLQCIVDPLLIGNNNKREVISEDLPTIISDVSFPKSMMPETLNVLFSHTVDHGDSWRSCCAIFFCWHLKVGGCVCCLQCLGGNYIIIFGNFGEKLGFLLTENCACYLQCSGGDYRIIFANCVGKLGFLLTNVALLDVRLIILYC